MPALLKEWVAEIAEFRFLGFRVLGFRGSGLGPIKVNPKPYTGKGPVSTAPGIHSSVPSIAFLHSHQPQDTGRCWDMF